MPEPARRIVVVISSLGGGGAERVVVDLCDSLVEAGRETVLLTLNGDDPDAYDVPNKVRRERMDIRRDVYFPGHSPVFFALNIAAMRQRIRALRPDVVVSFLDQTNIRAITCLAGTGIPVVVAERSNPSRHHLIQPWRTMRRITYGRARAVVVQTREVADWFARFVPADRIVIIPNAVRAAPEFARIPSSAPDPSGPLLLAVGRLGPVKGFDLLLDAFSRSGLSDAGWRLAILGEGPDRESLLAQAHKLGISRLALPGHVRNVSDWMAKATIFALTSRYEGFPNVLLEAMQMGRTCVSFDCPSGPRDIIDSGRNGLLVAPEDVGALADALRRLAADEKLRERLADAALDVNARFSGNEIYARWRDTLDRAASARLSTGRLRRIVAS